MDEQTLWYVVGGAVLLAILFRGGRKSRQAPKVRIQPGMEVESWSAGKLAFLNFLAAVVYAGIAYAFVNPALAQACDPAREWWMGLVIVFGVNVVIALILGFVIFPRALWFAGREMKALRGGGWSFAEFVMVGFMIYQSMLILDC